GQRSLIIVSSVIIILIGLWFLFSKDWPLFRDFLKMREEIYQLKKEYEFQKERLLKTQEIFKRFHSRLSEVEDISLALPIKEDYGQILSEIQFIAQKNNLTIDGLSFQKGIIKNEEVEENSLFIPCSTIVISLKGEGYYSEIKSFLKDIESDIRLMDIKRIDLTKRILVLPGKRAKTSNPLISFSTTISAYKQELK
ncbi:type 4a pilus biogenesis protein PilO, partial [bacterium]|nr:type 4a pilus biogenesis protein PilO [bacterium]